MVDIYIYCAERDASRIRITRGLPYIGNSSSDLGTQF